jgi:hypothetical protein
MTADNKAIFRWTRLGYTIAQHLDSLLPIVQTQTSSEGDESGAEKESGGIA